MKEFIGRLIVMILHIMEDHLWQYIVSIINDYEKLTPAIEIIANFASMEAKKSLIDIMIF